MLERCKNSSCTEVERGKKRQLIVEYVKQPQGSPQGNRRAGRAAGHCTWVGTGPAIRMGGCGGNHLNTQVSQESTALPTSTNEAIEGLTSFIENRTAGAWVTNDCGTFCWHNTLVHITGISLYMFLNGILALIKGWKSMVYSIYDITMLQ